MLASPAGVVMTTGWPIGSTTTATPAAFGGDQFPATERASRGCTRLRRPPLMAYVSASAVSAGVTVDAVQGTVLRGASHSKELDVARQASPGRLSGVSSIGAAARGEGGDRSMAGGSDSGSNFRFSYYDKAGIRCNLNETKALDAALSRDPVDIAKLCSLLQRISVPPTHRARLWKLILGVTPADTLIATGIEEDRRCQFEELRSTLEVMRRIDEDTSNADI
ncbi:TBC1 domain family member 7-like, partial [Tropilaelaps mercedesae]